MKIAKNGKISSGNVTFALPEGALLVLDGKVFDGGIELTDEKELLRILISEESGSPEARFREKDFCELYKALTPLTPFVSGSVKGVKLIYESENETFCEYRVNAGEKTLSLLGMTCRPFEHADYITESEIFKSLIAGLNAD